MLKHSYIGADAGYQRRTIGQPASSGTVTGKVRRLSSLEDLHLLQPGEILVTQQATPNWTPALSIAAGLISESGGALCNLATCARELSIPMVLSASGIWSMVRPEDSVEMDGSTGVIAFL